MHDYWAVYREAYRAAVKRNESRRRRGLFTPRGRGDHGAKPETHEPTHPLERS